MHVDAARVATLLAGALLVASVGQAAAAEVAITIDAMRFEPASVTVKRGDRVVWTNRDLVPHTATARGAFDSGVIAPGGSWAFAPARSGRHAYVCSLHPSMKALLVVE